MIKVSYYRIFASFLFYIYIERYDTFRYPLDDMKLSYIAAELSLSSLFQPIDSIIG